MSSKKDKASPATTSAAYDRMIPRWDLLDAVLGGTEALRAAAELYLPRHEAESDVNYKQRLESAVLENLYELTLDGLAGKPFKQDINVNEDVPVQIRDDILPDVDLQGKKLDIFLADWFRLGVHKGFAHVLVDFPRPSLPANGEQRTLADDRRENLRPYWVLVRPDNVIFLESKIVDGREILTHVRIRETEVVRDGFAEMEIERIRVLEPGSVTLFKKNEKGKWLEEDSWETGLKFIPMVTFYAAREDVALCKPPLMDLAYLNIAHWQSSSDQRHILTVSRFPLLAAKGVSEAEGKLKIGPNSLLSSENPDSEWYYVEHAGGAIAAGRTDLQDLRDSMTAYGAEFLRAKPGTETATAAALDSAEASTPLGKMIKVFQDCAAIALDFTAAWMKIASGVGGTIEIPLDFEYQGLTEQGLPSLEKARSSRDISRRTYLEGLKRRGVLPEDFDADEDREWLDEETELAAARIDIDPAAPDADSEDEEDPDNASENSGGDQPPRQE